MPFAKKETVIDKPEINVIEPLPAQPLNREKLLIVIRDSLKSADGKAVINAMIRDKEYLQDGLDITDFELFKKLFKAVKDGDERAILHKFFSNIDN